MSGVYDIARVRFATAQFNWPTTNFKLAAFSGQLDFVPTDLTIASITGRAKAQYLGISEMLAGMAVVADGTVQSGPVVLKGIAAAKTISFFTLVFYTGNELVTFIDDVEGLPYLTNGLDIIVQPDWSQSKGWFRA